jgi:AcrR family transcriptional regulator
MDPRDPRAPASAANLYPRLFAALGDALGRHGYSQMSIAQVIEVAGASRRTFYAHFSGKAEAFCAAHEEALDCLGEQIVAACEATDGWGAQVSAAIEAALAFAVSEPQRAQLLVGELFTAGPWPGYCHDMLLKRFGPSLRGPDAPQPDLTIEGPLLAGVATVIGGHLSQGATASLLTCAPGLTHFVLTPFLGTEEARRVASEAR